MSMQERESSGILPCLIDVILINILLFPLLTGKHFVLWLHYCTRWWTAWLQHSPVCLSEEKRYIHHELPFAIRLKELCHHISVFLVTEAGWGSPLSNQVRTWAMWFCDVVITPLARAWPAELALRPRSGVYFGVS